MNKTISIVLVSAFAIGAMAFGVHQSQEVSKTKAANEQLAFEKSNLQDDLSYANEQIDGLTDENEDLKAQIEVLEAKIAEYEVEIDKLKKVAYSRKKKVEEMEKEMKTLRSKYLDLERKIQALNEQEHINQQYIAQLEAEKQSLQQANDDIYRQSVQIKSQLDLASVDILELEKEKIKQEALLAIVESTQIFFDKVAIKKEQTGQDQRKIKKDGKAWNYTYIDLSFQHDNIQYLINETFVVKLIDIDNDAQPLSFVESNPAFPQSFQDNKGLQFEFKGEPMQVVFHNNEIKTGKNYALQLYYLKDGKEHRLVNGYQQFIADGKVLKYKGL